MRIQTKLLKNHVKLLIKPYKTLSVIFGSNGSVEKSRRGKKIWIQWIQMKSEKEKGFVKTARYVQAKECLFQNTSLPDSKYRNQLIKNC